MNPKRKAYQQKINEILADVDRLDAELLSRPIDDTTWQQRDALSELRYTLHAIALKAAEKVDDLVNYACVME